MERARETWGTLRAKGLLVAMTGAVALSGCSFGSDNEAAPVDTATYVEADDYQTPLGAYDYINTGTITTSIKARHKKQASTSAGSDTTEASPYKTLKNIDPKTGQDTEDFPIDESAAVLTISLGKNNKLIYEDATPGLNADERKLLAATSANAPMLQCSHL